MVLTLSGLPRTDLSVLAQPGRIESCRKISVTEGGFAGALNAQDFFGCALAPLGDMDGDGVNDLAVGASYDDDGAPDAGAVWILFLTREGTVKAEQKISGTEGGFTGELEARDFFASSVGALGDMNGDGVADLAVGARRDDDGASDAGALWLLFLRPDGTVQSFEKVSATEGGFGGELARGDLFGSSVVLLGDQNGDGVNDLAVGARRTDDGGRNRGAVWVLFMNEDGTVGGQQKISDTEGGFAGSLDNRDLFGSTVAALGDLNGDGVGDLAVGAPYDDDGTKDAGAVWVLFLNEDGTVRGHRKISSEAGGFTGGLDSGDHFGSALAFPGDLDGDGVGELAVGAKDGADGRLEGDRPGVLWILFLERDGTVKAHRRIDAAEEGFTGTLSDGDWFGKSAAFLGDLDGDGVGDLAVGAAGDADGGYRKGAVWVLFLAGIDGR